MARYRVLTALWMAARERAGGKLTQEQEALGGATWTASGSCSPRTSRTPSRQQRGSPALHTREYGRPRPSDPSPRVRIKTRVSTVLEGVAGGASPGVILGVAEDADDPELAQLKALNRRLEDLHALRWDSEGREDPTVVITIDALDTEAAALIRARCDRTLAPIIAATDAAIAEAHRLLGLPPPGGA